MEAHALPNPFSFHVPTLLFTILLSISHPIQSVSASTTPQATPDFIRTSCDTTTYPPLCYKTLSPYAASVQNNPWKLCDAALTVTLKAAKNTSKIVSKLAQQKGITSRDAAVIKDCIENIGNSIDELKESVKAMGTVDSSSDKKFQMDSIKTWVSAAITDENTCTDGFSGSKVSDSVKNMIRNSISSFIRLTSNALSLINQLSY